MMKKYVALTLLLLPSLAVAKAPSREILDQAAELRDAALKDDTAYRYLEALTTEVGPRLAGTEDEARARAWSVKALKRLGFRHVRVEPFEMETWVRGEETARILEPYPQPLSVTALGRSGSTGRRELTGELVVFDTLDQVEALPAGALNGKVAYVSHRMGKTQDGSSYGYFGKVRFRGPSIAASKGAKAILIRSVGTDSHRFPHTGGTSWEEGQARIPALALSNPDADQIERIAGRTKSPIRVGMTVTPKMIGTRESGNVIVDLPGRERPEEVVIVGGHLDSWDLGTGAVDDGAGVAITAAAVHLIQKSGLEPERTIRLVHWGAEEVGLYGAKAYAEKHAAELDKHVVGSESDFGAERVYAIHANVSEAGEEVLEAVLRVLAPLGVGRGTFGPTFTGSGGPDLIPLNSRGMPRVRLAQDGTDYFDLHHTPDDTFDKIDPDALAQNVAAYAAFLWITANSDVDFRPTADRASIGE